MKELEVRHPAATLSLPCRYLPALLVRIFCLQASNKILFSRKRAPQAPREEEDLCHGYRPRSLLRPWSTGRVRLPKSSWLFHSLIATSSLASRWNFLEMNFPEFPCCICLLRSIIVKRSRRVYARYIILLISKNMISRSKSCIDVG